MAADQKIDRDVSADDAFTVFEVGSGGTLRLADHREPQVRSDLYAHLGDFWTNSPAALVEAMEECQPLAWAVQSIYSDFRHELEGKLQDSAEKHADGSDVTKELSQQLDALPEEPEEGAEMWLLSMTTEDFAARVVPVIEDWFGDEPDWDSEDGHFPESSTSQGAALEFFRDLSTEELALLGVDIVEGEHPGSSYFAAELRVEIDEANRAAAKGGIPVKFVAARQCRLRSS